ncbi:MAG: TetR/AcrR family transcriptional regulator [Flavobacteriaceae bacterium]
MKENIVLKASALFIQRGFKSVTMDDLAEVLGISKKTLYTHFDNKVQLVRESSFFVFDSVCKEIEAIKEKAAHPIEELYTVKSAVLKYYQNEDGSPVYQLQKYYPEIYSELKDQEYDRLAVMVQSSLKLGVNTGLFRPNIDTDFVSRLYLNGMRGIRDIGIFPPEQFNMKTLFENYLEYHARAIVTPKGLTILNEFIATTDHL